MSHARRTYRLLPLAILALLLLLPPTASTAQTLEWIREPKSDAAERALGVDAGAKAVYAAGWTDGELERDEDLGGTLDAFVMKYDEAGTRLWVQQFGTDGHDDAGGVSVVQGRIYVAGSTNGRFRDQPRRGRLDGYVATFASNGDRVWVRQFGSDKQDLPRAVAATTDGIYVAGWTEGDLRHGTNQGGKDVFVRAYRPDGDVLWTREFGTPKDDAALGISAIGDHIYVAGRTEGTLPGQTGVGGTDAFVRAYDLDGERLWTRQFGSSTADGAEAITASADAVYVAGGTDGALPGQSTAGGTDAFVRAYDSHGVAVWTRQFGGVVVDDDDERAIGVAVNADSVFVGGWTSAQFPGFSNQGFSDAYIRGYDLAGNLMGTAQFGTDESEGVTGLAATASAVYASGGTTGEFFPNRNPTGYSDLFVAKAT